MATAAGGRAGWMYDGRRFRENAYDMGTDYTRTIAVVGAGFSGTALTVRLLGAARAERLRILLIESTGDAGPGLAYRRQAYPYLLNVPVSRMSLDESLPGDFLDYARPRLPAVAAGDYLPRALYGEYLRTRLGEAIARRGDNQAFDLIKGTVSAVSVRPAGGYRLEFADGRKPTADVVVLATGTPAPHRLPEFDALGADARYWHDPWQAPPAVDAAAPPLVIGTGLTMADFVCAWHEAHPAAPIHALSRHGLLPLAQSPVAGPGFDQRSLEHDLASLGTCRQLVAAVRETAGGAADWRDVVTFVRHRLPGLWPRLARAERQRFLRHVRAYWDIHRHRLPPDVHARLEALSARGILEIHAGRIRGVAANGRGLAVTYRPRGKHADETLPVSVVINCTGPDYAAGPAGTPLGASLLDAGLASPDATLSGWRTGPLGQLIDRDGREVPALYYLGPLLRGRDWEATAVGELREHATRLAAHLAAHLPST